MVVDVAWMGIHDVTGRGVGVEDKFFAGLAFGVLACLVVVAVWVGNERIHAKLADVTATLERIEAAVTTTEDGAGPVAPVSP